MTLKNIIIYYRDPGLNSCVVENSIKAYPLPNWLRNMIDFIVDNSHADSEQSLNKSGEVERRNVLEVLIECDISKFQTKKLITMYPSSQLFETYCKPQLSSLESEVTYWYDHSQVKSHSYLQSEYQKQFQNKLNCPTPLFTPNQLTRSVESVVFFLGRVTSWDGVHGVVGADTGFHTRALGGTEEIKTGDYVLVRAEAVHNNPLFKWCGIKVQVVDKTFTTVDKNSANQPKLPIFLNPPPSLPRALDPEVPPAPRISKPDILSLSKSERPKKRKRESYYVNDRHSGGSRSTHTSRYEEKFRTSSRKKEKKDSRRRNYEEHDKYSTKKHRHSDSKKRKLNKEVVSGSSGTSSRHETKYIRKSQSRNEDVDEIKSQKIVQNKNTKPTQEPDDVPSSNVEQTDTFADNVESLSGNNDNMLNKNSAIPATRDSLENSSPEDNLVACVDITNFNEEIEATMKYLDELLPGIFLETPDPTIPISMTEIKKDPSNEIATELNRDLAEGIDITNSISNEIPAETTNDTEEKCDNDLVVEQSNESAEELTADDLILTISTIGQPLTPLSALLLGENVSGRLSPIENINTLIECSSTNEDEDVNSLEEGEIASSSEDYGNETNERDSVSDTLNVQELPNRITKDLTITGTVIYGPWNFNPEEPWGRKSKMRSDYPSEWKPVTRKAVRKVVTRIERSRTRDEIAYQPEYFSSDGNGHLYWSESRYSSDDDERTYDEDTNVWVRKNSGN